MCNLSWSKNINELVSTHGYSQNQIIVWRYPTMQKLATLTGHTMRVLYLAVSPDGQTIVTGGRACLQQSWHVPGCGCAALLVCREGRLAGSCVCLDLPHSSPLPPPPFHAGAGDETLRFWNVFPGPKAQGSGSDSGMGSMMRTLIR